MNTHPTILPTRTFSLLHRHLPHDLIIHTILYCYIYTIFARIQLNLHYFFRRNHSSCDAKEDSLVTGQTACAATATSHARFSKHLSRLSLLNSIKCDRYITSSNGASWHPFFSGNRLQEHIVLASHVCSTPRSLCDVGVSVEFETMSYCSLSLV